MSSHPWYTPATSHPPTLALASAATVGAPGPTANNSGLRHHPWQLVAPSLGLSDDSLSHRAVRIDQPVRCNKMTNTKEAFQYTLTDG